MAMKTTIHDLHNDLLLCIFDYFTVHEIYEAFSETISCLTLLLINSRIRLHSRKPIFTGISSAQVISIDLKYLPKISSPTISDFSHLRSLILHDFEDLQVLINHQFPESLEILHLNISLRHKPAVIIPLLSLLTQLSKLKSYTLNYPSSYFILEEDQLNLSRPSTIIRNVQIHIKCTINFIEKLLSLLPRLRRFRAIVGSNSENISVSSENLLFSNIQYLSLVWDYMPFHEILTLCRKMPNLQECTFNASDNRADPNVFNPIIWRQFIEMDHLLLKKLLVDMKFNPSAGQARHRQPHQATNDPYFYSINFKIERDHWSNPLLFGNYMKSTE